MVVMVRMSKKFIANINADGIHVHVRVFTHVPCRVVVEEEDGDDN